LRRFVAHRPALALAFVLLTPCAQSRAAEQTIMGEEGRYYDAAGQPTYRIAQDGRADWSAFNGFRRYHAECHVCHGPNGDGSSFAPSLLEPLKMMSFQMFRDIVADGVQSAGPAQPRGMRPMKENRNVMCYVEDIYVYLKARADGVLGRGRPAAHEPKPGAAARQEAACLSRD
jgi:methanol metabolism-related c-type cytochrome